MFRHPYIISQQSHLSRPPPMYRPVAACSASRISWFICIIGSHQPSIGFEKFPVGPISSIIGKIDDRYEGADHAL